jgi:hypothetical protein
MAEAASASPPHQHHARPLERPSVDEFRQATAAALGKRRVVRTLKGRTPLPGIFRLTMRLGGARWEARKGTESTDGGPRCGATSGARPRCAHMPGPLSPVVEVPSAPLR